MRRRDKLDLDAELARLDRGMAQAIIDAVTGPPPTHLGNRIRAARGAVKARALLGEESTPERIAFASQPIPEEPDAPPWTPPPVIAREPAPRRRWWQRKP